MHTVFVLSGPSGVGKTTLAQLLLDSDRSFKRSVSYTTRAPRPGYENGIAYHFVGSDVFAKMSANGDFLETAKVYDDWYGTSVNSVKDILETSDALLVLDTEGCKSVKTCFANSACVIFLAPAAIADLEARLKRRASDSDEIIKKRLSKAWGEVATGIEIADYVVVNDDLSIALADVISVVRATRIKIRNRAELSNKLSIGV